MSERNVLLKNVKHPFLVGLHFSFQTSSRLYFILDYINGGEVSRSSIQHTFFFLFQLAVALSFFFFHYGKILLKGGKLLDLAFPYGLPRIRLQLPAIVF